MKKLTLEEKNYIEKELEKLLKYSEASHNAIKNGEFRPVTSAGNAGFDDLPDFCLLNDNARIEDEIIRLRSILKCSVFVEASVSEQIEIGSKFVATISDFDGGKITDKYLLVGGDTVPFMDDSDLIPVATSSPFGAAVLGKKENEEFSYIAPNKKVINGVINEIIIEKTKEENKEETSGKKLVKTSKNTSKC